MADSFGIKLGVEGEKEFKSALSDINLSFKELQDFIAGQETDITEFDEALVKKLIEKITVFADHFTVEFKSGVTIDIEAKKDSSPLNLISSEEPWSV